MLRLGGEIGKHMRLKISRPLGLAGSIPARGIIFIGRHPLVVVSEVGLSPSLVDFWDLFLKEKI
jgi:hypothetical protein